MRCHLAFLLTFAAVVLCGSTARAGLILTVSTTSLDLNQLVVGQTVHFDVVLSGLGTNDRLDYLAGTVTFDSPLLGTPTPATPGAIIPDPTGFVGEGLPGVADAFYDAVFFSATNTPITANGVFYSFDVVTQQPGSGQLVFDVASLAASDGNNIPVPLDGGPPLPFTIGSVTAVPEPGSVVMTLTMAVSCGGAMALRRLVRRRTARV